MIKTMPQLLILLSLLSVSATGQNNKPFPSDKVAKAGRLELPSLSIFGWSQTTVPNEVDKPFSPSELDQFLTEVKKSKARNKSTEHDRNYWIIPMVFYKSRHIFSKESWTVEEIKQGRQISKFFAELTDKSDLEIRASEQEAFRQGLLKLRDWFAAMCQDNRTLAAMIFTLDDGPFFGNDIDINEYSRMRLVESAAIPGKQAMFVLMTDGSKPEPMVLRSRERR